MAKVLAMFPGQGSQYVGMGREVLSEFPSTKVIFEEVEDAAGFSIRKLCFEGPDEDLKLTANTQPSILATTIALWTVLKSEAGFSPFGFAGHSLGEYSALVAADRLSLSRAAFLVRRRGQAMQQAVPPGMGAMAAILNVSEEDLVYRCKEVSGKDEVLEIVNFNAPGQLVVAGHKSAVDQLCKSLTDAGFKSVLLPVSAPFHSSLMHPAREVMRPLLEATEFKPSNLPIIANLTGQFEAEYGARFLVDQVSSPVLWTQSLNTAYQAGCDVFFEVGPGKVLFGLARRTLPKSMRLLHSEDLKKAIKDIQSFS